MIECTNEECKNCDELCNWIGGKVRVCCPRGYIWEQGCRSPLEVGKEVEKPDCNDLDFNRDGEVSIADAGAIADNKIDYISMEKHFKEEIDRLIKKEIGLL